MSTRPTHLVMAALLLASACSRKPEPEADTSPRPVSSPPSSVPQPTVAPPRPATGPEPVWTDPAGWKRLAPTNPMRKATYKIPAAPSDSEDAEMAVFYFGRDQGGGTDANIERWISQFPDVKPADVKRTERTVNGMKQTMVELEGTYSGSGMPGAATGSKANYRLIGAVVESPVGSYFFKMTGPKKTVESARGSYMTLLDGMKPG